jgi:hypothetical protein
MSDLLAVDHDKLDNLALEVLDPRGSIALMKNSIKRIKEREASGGKMTCHGVSFNSLMDFLLWFEQNDLSIACFVDSKTLSSCVNPTVVSQETATKNLESQSKIDITTNVQAAIVTSFQGTIPPVLAGGKTDAEGGAYDVLIGYQENFEKWDPRGQGKGLKGRVSAGTQAARKCIEILQGKAGISGDAQSLATGLLNDSIRFLDCLLNWMTKGYRELREDTMISPANLWSMFKECEAKIWEDISDTRNQYADAARAEPGCYVWGILKAWEIQERYCANNFQDDPALTGIFTR